MKYGESAVTAATTYTKAIPMPTRQQIIEACLRPPRVYPHILLTPAERARFGR